jgi:hypothetical protein
VAQGKANVHGLESLPIPETQVWDMAFADAGPAQSNAVAIISKMLRIFI